MSGYFFTWKIFLLEDFSGFQVSRTSVSQTWQNMSESHHRLILENHSLLCPLVLTPQPSKDFLANFNSIISMKLKSFQCTFILIRKCVIEFWRKELAGWIRFSLNEQRKTKVIICWELLPKLKVSGEGCLGCLRSLENILIEEMGIFILKKRSQKESYNRFLHIFERMLYRRI